MLRLLQDTKLFQEICCFRTPTRPRLPTALVIYRFTILLTTNRIHIIMLFSITKSYPGIQGGMRVRTSEVISITLPPRLLKEAERLAKKEGRTRSELFREALRRYLAEQSSLELQRYGAQQARKLGIESDEDILGRIKEYRQERRQQK